MNRSRLAQLGLIIGLAALLTPLGLYVLRLGLWVSFGWVFGIWALLVVLSFLANCQARDDEEV